MYYEYGHKLTEAEIYQAGVEREEKLAELKKAVVNLYRDEQTGEVFTVCTECFKDEALQTHMVDLTYIDKAASWDECRFCDAQNVPASYHGEV